MSIYIYIYLNKVNHARRRRTKFETLRPQALKGSLLYQIFVINQSVFEIYKFRILPAAGAYDKHHDEDTTKHPQFETLRPQALKGSLLHQICVINQSILEVYKFRILPAAGAYHKHDDTKHPKFETLRPQTLKGSLLHQIFVINQSCFEQYQLCPPQAHKI